MIEKKEEEGRETEREKRRTRANDKKVAYLRKREKEQNVRRITEMLQKIPSNEKERIEREVRLNEKERFVEIKQNLWRRWRGKQEQWKNKDKLPTGIDKVEERMIEMERKILEMREAEEKAKERIKKQKKRKDEEKMRKERMKNHWMMMGWLTRY